MAPTCECRSGRRSPWSGLTSGGGLGWGVGGGSGAGCSVAEVDLGSWEVETKATNHVELRVHSTPMDLETVRVK